MNLLKRIVDEFGVDSFTLNDVLSFNPLSALRHSSTRGNRFGTSHLNQLVSIGALNYDPDQNSYLLNPTSRFVVDII